MSTIWALIFSFIEGLLHFWGNTFTVFLFASLILNKRNFLKKKKKVQVQSSSVWLKEESKSFPIVVVQSLSHVQLFVTSWTVALQASLSCSISRSLVKSISIELVMLKSQSYQLILCCPLFLFPSIFSRIKTFYKVD